MRLFPIWLPLLLMLDSTVAGLGMPAPHHIAERAVNCKVVTGVLAAVKNLGGLATSYCSSYLHIPATTTLTSITTGTPGYVFTRLTNPGLADKTSQHIHFACPSYDSDYNCLRQHHLRQTKRYLARAAPSCDSTSRVAWRVCRRRDLVCL